MRAARSSEDCPIPQEAPSRGDHQARLQFEDVEVMISTEFRLQRGDQQFDLDPGDRAGLGPLLALYPAALASSSVEGDGTLRLAFDNGDSISVAPHASYEPWQISGPATALVVCTPGIPASLAVWA